MTMFFVAKPEEIKKGAITDVYFLRSQKILEERGIDRRVRAEVVAKNFPAGYEWAVLSGLDDVLQLLEGVEVTVEGLQEGSLFRPNQPVLSIEGRYLAFGIYETTILGLLCQASGVATKAARCRKAARDRTLVHFGARRMHPAIAPMIDRSAYLGGCDGVSVVCSARMLGLEPSGTIPHALVLLMGDTLEAARALDELMEPQVPRVALIDTFQDEKFEAIRLAEALGPRLGGLRLDTPGSRRGDFARILQEVRWELDLRGCEKIQLFVSGGLDEPAIAELRPWADAFGVGTAISNAPVIDLSLDIVEVENRPLAKRGKESGGKRIFRCRQCLAEWVLPRAREERRCRECGGETECRSTLLMEEGRVIARRKPVSAIREEVLQCLAAI